MEKTFKVTELARENAPSAWAIYAGKLVRVASQTKRWQFAPHVATCEDEHQANKLAAALNSFSDLIDALAGAEAVEMERTGDYAAMPTPELQAAKDALDALCAGYALHE